MHSIASCSLISATYVCSLYVWRTPAWRQHPQTVKWRMMGVLLTSCVAWVPAWLMHRQLREQTPVAGHDAAANMALPPLLQLLGLQHRDGGVLLAAVLKPLLVTAILLMGPLHHMACQQWQQWRLWGQHKLASGADEPARSASSDGGSPRRWPLTVHMVRDYVVAPVAEEWCFRACMVPLLRMQGFARPEIVVATPLFFGACHVHHARELVKVYGCTRMVAAQVLLQLAYTTLFGWYATWLFVTTASILPAMLVHSLCNLLGLPPFAEMSWLSRLLCVVGVVSWALEARHWL